MSLEERLDSRLHSRDVLDSVQQGDRTFAQRMGEVRREVRARKYEEAARQIEIGSVTVIGADTMDVIERLYRKADSERSK